MGFVFPILLFCYIMYLVLCLQSLIFAILYENFDYFKRFSNWVIFGASEEPFASEYFKWFWGNMFKKAGEKAASAAAAAAAIEAKRQHENAKKLAYADKQTDKADGTNEGFKTPQNRADFHTDRRDEWVEENGSVTWVIKKAREFFSGSGSNKPGSFSLENFNIIPDIGPLGIDNLIILVLKKISKWF
jgi:hypothetical protein